MAKNPRKITVQFDDMTDDAYAAFANGLWYLASAARSEGDFSVTVGAKDVPLLNKEWKRPSPEWRRH